MPVRIAAIGVGHWHSLYDAAYLKTLAAMSDVSLVAIQDADSAIVGSRAAELGEPRTFTDYREMLESVRPDFVIALGRHSDMAAVTTEEDSPGRLTRIAVGSFSSKRPMIFCESL